MSPEEIESHVNRISWGGRFVEIELDGEEYLFVIKPPSLRDKNFINFIYKKSLDEARNRGILTKFEYADRLKILGLWTEKDESNLHSIREQLSSLYEQRKDFGNKPNKRLDRLIKGFEKSLKKEFYRKQELFGFCAEDYAAGAKTDAIVWACTYDTEENKYWPTWRHFQNETNRRLIDKLCSKMGEENSIGVKEIREIARSTSWRFKWAAAKNISNLFGKPIVELNVEQQNLLYWSQVYDSVYESMERPSDEVIEDDEALDKWFEEQSRKRKVEKVEKSGDVGKVKLSSRVARHGEIFVVVGGPNNPNGPSIEDIDGLNPEMVRKFKQRELDSVKKRKMVNEKDLRNRNDRIARKIIGSRAAIVSGNGFGNKGKQGKIYPGEFVG